MPAKITNESIDALPLPYPLRGVLSGGKSIIINETVARVEAWVPEVSATGGFKVSDMPGYTGPFDTSYGPKAGEAGVSPVHVVDLVTAAALAANTYSATNKTITLDATGTLTVDGVLTALNDRIFVKDEGAAKNGLYRVTTAGAVGVAAVLTRDWDWKVSADVEAGMLVVAKKGTANTGLLYVVAFSGAFTLDTTVPTASATGGVPPATTTAPGTLSAADKTFLNRLHEAAGANLADAATETIQIGAGTWRKLPTLGQNGVLTIGTTGAVAGDIITITRLDTSAFTYAIVNGGAGAGTLATLPVSKVAFVDVQFDGTNWALKRIGQLA